MTVKSRNYSITANQDTLNYLAILCYEASVAYKAKGYEGLTREAEELMDAIHDSLFAKGFYKN